MPSSGRPAPRQPLQQYELTDMQAAHAVTRLAIPVSGQRVSGLLMSDARSTSCLVLAHGAGAGMNHPFMERCAQGLLARGMASLRYQFPYMEKGGRRPDAPALCHATVRAAVDAAHQALPDV